MPARTTSPNYNTSPQLWRTYRAERKDKRPLCVANGHIVEGSEAIGRFDDDRHAEMVLTEAGWVKTAEGWE